VYETTDRKQNSLINKIVRQAQQGNLIQAITRKILRTILKPYYLSGKKYHCPVCGIYARKFLPVNKSRENAECPKCSSLERHRLLWLYLQERPDNFFFTKNIKLLHIAPEKVFAEKISKMTNIEYIQADLNGSGEVIKMDIENIQFPENSFDMILCNHVLEHVSDDRKAMKEFYRVLKPEGLAVIMVPINYNSDKTYEDPTITDPAQRKKAFKQEDHVRLYGLDIEERFKEAGFKVCVEEYTSKINANTKTQCRLPDREHIFACCKV
jgi:predicted SAM-dependent methyltransferase